MINDVIQPDLQANSTFTDFVRELYAASDRAIDTNSFSAKYIVSIFKSLLKMDQEIDKIDKKIHLDYLEKEYYSLGIDKLSRKQLSRLGIKFFSGHSCGWVIPAAEKKVFVRFDRKESDRDVAFNTDRPDFIGGVEVLHGELHPLSTMETHLEVNTLATVPALQDQKLQKKLIAFNDAVLQICGYSSVSEVKRGFKHAKSSDYGVKFFLNEGIAWQPIQPADCMKVTFEKGEFKTAQGKLVVPVPYLFDTDMLKVDQPISREEQRKRLEAFWINEEATAELAERIGLSQDMINKMIECYMDYDNLNYKPPVISDFRNKNPK